MVARNRNLGWLVLVMAGMLACETGQSTVENAGPNVIFILSDDHANRTISAYGSGVNQTPHIDRLAEEGALFLRNYCGNSICGPSRASILTGKHSHKNGITGNAAPWDGTQTLLPRLMQENGYQTALFGKWHLNSNPGDEFDEWEILTGAGRQGFYYNPYFIHKDGSDETIEGYSTDIITDKALSWIDGKRNADKPFMLFVQYKVAHVPRMPRLDYLERYAQDTIHEPATLFDDFDTRSHYATDVNFHIDDYRPLPQYDDHEFEKNIYWDRMTETQRKAYHGVIDPRNQAFMEMKAQGMLDDKAEKRYAYQRFIKDYLRLVDILDDNIGRLLTYLDQHPALKENTVVIYSSDQSYFTGEHGYAEKRLMYEPAMQMPLLIRWPGRIDPGIRISHLTQNIDFAPSILDMSGIQVPADMQGKSFAPLLDREMAEDWRSSLYYHYYDHGIHKVGRHDGIRTERYKLIHFYTDDVYECYDLKEDPHEVNNIYGNPEHHKLIDELKSELSDLRTHYEVPDWVFDPPYVSNKGITRTER